MLAVVAAGNAGDSYDIGGSPGNAPRGIGVAATNDGYGVFDGWQVLSPAGLVDGTRPGLRSIAYTGQEPDSPATWLTTPAGNEDACAPLPDGVRRREGPARSRPTASPAARSPRAPTRWPPARPGS